jgi:uncharacterized protein (TIGR03435 family)
VTAMIRTAVSAIPLVCCWVMLAQPARERPSFEVASVKAMLVDDPKSDFVPRRSGDRITMHNAQLRTIIVWAYHLTNAEYELVAAPTEKLLWDDYDIQALAPGSPTDDDLRMMFQALLEDRFQLKVHREKRELAAYDLVVAKGGPKLVPAPSRSIKPGIGFGSSSSWTASGPIQRNKTRLHFKSDVRRCPQMSVKTQLLWRPGKAVKSLQDIPNQ